MASRKAVSKADFSVFNPGPAGPLLLSNSHNDMAVTPLRYGIIGCGSMGREHIENIHALPGAVVTAIADPFPASRAAAMALLNSEVKVFEHHQALLDSGL